MTLTAFGWSERPPVRIRAPCRRGSRAGPRGERASQPPPRRDGGNRAIGGDRPAACARRPRSAPICRASATSSACVWPTATAMPPSRRCSRGPAHSFAQASSERRPQLLAANVDVVFVVTAADGDLNLPRIERYLALVRESRSAPVIVLNKADLATDADATTATIAAIAPGVPVHAISARDRDGIQVLEQYFDGNKTVGFIGSSGVGKSTLTNELLGRAAQATGKCAPTTAAAGTRPRIASCSCGRKAAPSSTRRECVVWSFGIRAKTLETILTISKAWPASASFAIAA